MNKYLKDYKWSHIGAMLRNNKRDPKICRDDFTGRLVVISGATSGIGYDTVREYASHGADIICINRNQERSESLCEEIKREFKVDCSYYLADFTRLSEVHAVGKVLANIDRDIEVLIHNAGVYQTKRTFTDDGLEQVFQVNYLSSFILTYLLRDKLISQQKARILYVNSEGHRFAISGFHLDDLKWAHHRYSGAQAYGSAKTAQLLSLYPFLDQFAGSNVMINAMHPGDVKTNMGENNGKIYKFFKHLLINPMAKSSEISADALYYLGVSEELEGTKGKFFNFTTEEIPAPHALDKELGMRLWDKSLELGGL